MRNSESGIKMLGWKKFRNTYLQVPWLFRIVISDRQYDQILSSHRRTFIDWVQRILEKTFWFWPRIIDASSWALGSLDSNRTPYNFMSLDEDAELLLSSVESRCPDLNAQILDIGCNCGRHMIELWRRGYRNLTGVDAMKTALNVFMGRAPDVYHGSNVYHDLFQRFLLNQEDRKFDIVYSHGATIELIHPSFDIVAHLCRVTKSHICLLLCPYNGYPRYWINQFESHNFMVIYRLELTKNADQRLLLVLSRK